MKKISEKQLDILLVAGIGILAGTAAGACAALKSAKLNNFLQKIAGKASDAEEDMFEDEEMIELPEETAGKTDEEEIFEEE